MVYGLGSKGGVGGGVDADAVTQVHFLGGEIAIVYIEKIADIRHILHSKGRVFVFNDAFRIQKTDFCDTGGDGLAQLEVFYRHQRLLVLDLHIVPDLPFMKNREFSRL